MKLRMKSRSSVRGSMLGIALMVTLLCSWQFAVAEKAKRTFAEVPLELNVALVLPNELMAGEGYKIDPVAFNDGYSNTYTLMTDVGEVQAISDYQLRRQIQEVQALQALDEMSRAGVFGDSLKEGVIAPFRGAKNLVVSPIKTTTGAVKGVGRWFGNIGRAATSDDPYQEGAVSAAVGWAGTKRAFALELGVDPNTDWEPLQKALSSVARAAFAGGITVGAAMGAVTGPAGTAIEVTSTSDDMNAMLLDNPPEGLTKINRKKLKNMGISNEVIDPFLRNYNYTPMEKSLLVEALNRMDGAKGRELFIAQAAAAPDRIIARYYQQTAEMMANYHNSVEAADIIKVANDVWLKNRKGALVGSFAIDYLAWTAEAFSISRAVEREWKGKPMELWLEGSASPEAKEGLSKRGWKVKERVKLLTGKPLQEETASGAGLGGVGATVRTIF